MSSLSFREQLEQVSLKLFSPQSETNTDPSASPLNFNLEFPLGSPLEHVDLPVAFVRGHWAGYSCHFNESWYVGEFRGMTPLDDFGVRYDKMVNIWLFTFPLVAVSPSVYYAYRWLVSNTQEDNLAMCLLRACKVQLVLEAELETYSAFMLSESNGYVARKIVRRALEEFSHLYSFTMLNYYYPMIEECIELTWLEMQDLVLHPYGRARRDCWYIPMIPAGLFRSPRFRILTWQLLQ